MRHRSSFSAPDPHRLYRNREMGKVFGVCAGIADFFGIEPVLVRIGVVVGLIFLSVPVLIAYLLAALILPERPPTSYRSPAEEAFARAAANHRPRVTLDVVRQRYADVEKRLRALECHVSSPEHTLSREIRNLDRYR